MVSQDRDGILRQLTNLSSESLAEMLRRRDTSRWREEVFEIAERILAERAGGRRPQAATPAAAQAVRPSAPPAHSAPTAATGPVVVAARSAPPAQAQVSPLGFEEQRADAIAVHCSDGRFSEHFRQFLVETLQIPRCDRLAVPGGPALLAGRLASYWESCGVENQVRFLIETHELRRVVLIAHEGCGYYTRKLALPEARVEQAQIEDIEKAARTLVHLGLQVTAYMVRRRGTDVLFEPVTVL
jgi:hypothetical protein